MRISLPFSLFALLLVAASCRQPTDVHSGGATENANAVNAKEETVELNPDNSATDVEMDTVLSNRGIQVEEIPKVKSELHESKAVVEQKVIESLDDAPKPLPSSVNEFEG